MNNKIQKKNPTKIELPTVYNYNEQTELRRQMVQRCYGNERRAAATRSFRVLAERSMNAMFSHRAANESDRKQTTLSSCTLLKYFKVLRSVRRASLLNPDAVQLLHISVHKENILSTNCPNNRVRISDALF